MKRPNWIGSFLIFFVVVGTGGSLAAWKYASLQESQWASENQPEPMETVTIAVVNEIEHRPSTTAIGTVLALRSITLQNELSGTVREVNFKPGQIVKAGTVLIALDVSVEEAELKALTAQAALARTVHGRRQSLSRDLAASQEEADRARADFDVALAQMARIKAIIARKTIRAPFNARVGLADVHPGQYLSEGTQLTTLQGIDDAVHVDFSIPQQVAAGLRAGDLVEVFSGSSSSPIAAKIVALDARIDTTTRNSMVRARVEGAAHTPVPGTAVRVRVPVGPARKAVVVPVNALRKGAEGDQVFVIATDKHDQARAHVRKVESGAMLDDKVVIYAGLSAGEQVAASGSFKLREGTLVMIAGDSPPGPGVMLQ
ncbi:MAG: efflux RND transporter periplasmic adaptor subunit [Nitrospirales bacterium]|nr:efflux RND transporter periplasmic adaptor subunit [Nitrospirales bacterium]